MPGAAGHVEVVSSSAAATLLPAWPEPLSRETVEAATRSAERLYGLAGVRVSLPGEAVAVALLTTGPGVPDAHPLAAGGLDHGAVGLLAVLTGPAEDCLGSSPPTSSSRWLAQALASRLAGRARSIEAHGVAKSAATPYAPAAAWLAAAGFRALDQPPHRYRLDLAQAVRSRPLDWARRVAVGWSPQPAPATRV
jgi:hypothetical protein